MVVSSPLAHAGAGEDGKLAGGEEGGKPRCEIGGLLRPVGLASYDGHETQNAVSGGVRIAW
jgi:hypothetical protein